MKLGITTPVMTRLPGAHADWEADAEIDDVAEIARAAERFGYHHLTASDHVGIPEPVAKVRGGTYWDPLSVFGYLAAVTERIRFQTHVLVIGYYHPLELAKRYGTCDRVTGGRLVLGIGVGSLREEFELLDAPFEDRGERADEALRALRASFAERLPEFHGRYWDYSGFIVDPCGVQEHVPIWIGGRTYRSLRRAVELGDGWVPFGLRSAQISEWMARARDTEAWEQRESPLEVVLQTERPLDPKGDPGRALEQVGRMRDAGATIVTARFLHASKSEYLEQLEAFASVAGDA